MTDKIVCEICGDEVHMIQLHLRDAHGEDSKTPMTVAEYKELYPFSPLLSEMAKKKLDATSKKMDKVDQSGKRGMSDVFGWKKSSDAPDIMISISDRKGFEDMIPEADPNYVYDVELLKTCLMALEKNIPCYLYGHSGIGKSTVWENICALTLRRFVRIQHTINTEESHIVGQWTSVKELDEHGNGVSVTKFELGPLANAMKHGWVYLADEYDRGHPQVLSCYQAVLEGKPLYIKEADEANRVIKPHADFRFIGTGNTNGSGDDTGLYQATIAQDAATFERWGICEKVTYMDARKEAAIVASQSKVNSTDAKKIIDFCKKVREGFPNEVSLTPGPRVAIRIAQIGLMKMSFQKGVELSFANKLPESERKAVLEIAQRIFG